jgi:hypothetical protein
MCDLRRPAADRKSRERGAVSRPWRVGLIGSPGSAIGARGSFFLGLAGLIAVACGCPSSMRAPRVVEAVEGPVIELWVDGSALQGGDGSSDHPYRDLKPALVPGALIHLAAGIYPGPIALPEGAAVIAKGGAGVISLEGPGTVVTAGKGRLEGISIQGGDIGLVVKGRLSSKDLHLSGQRSAGAQVESSGEWSAEKLEVVGVIPDVDGVRALPGSKTNLRSAKFRGSLRRGVDARDAEVTLLGAASVGMKEQLHQVGGRVRVEQSSAAQGTGPAYFTAAGVFVGKGLEVQGHEYAVLSADRAVLELSGITSRAPERAALGLVRSQVTVSGAQLEGGNLAAVQLLECDSRLSDVQVTKALGSGVVVRQGKATLERLVVQEVALDGDTGGDGLHLRGGEVTLRDVLVQHAAGAAVFVSAAARVHVFGLGAERCKNGALVVELNSSVDAKGVVVKDPDGPALVVPDGSSLHVTDLLLSGASVPVWAECGAGAQVTLTGVRGADPWEPPACVQVRRR